MIPRFSLARPTSLAQAFDAHAAANGEAAYIAGGTELLQVMKMGFAEFATLIDLKGIRELGGLHADDGGLRIGATTTHRDVERSQVVRRSFPALAWLEERVANVRVRNTGTIGGNLAFAEPHSDPATLFLACGATVGLASPRGTRRLSIDDFVVGPLSTSREPDEIVTDVFVPARLSDEGRGYAKIAFFERPAASVAVRVRVGHDVVTEAHVAVGSLTETPMLVPTAAAALVGAAADASAEAPQAALDAVAAVDAVEDLNGSADYKRHLAGVLLRRALRSAVAEAVGRA